MIIQNILTIKTQGRGLIPITPRISEIVSQSNVETGLCNLFLHHTSASLILGENFDPTVQEDLENFMQRLVPDGDRLFKHTTEGPDDMPAHVRAVLTQNSLTIPISNFSLSLGTWQGIFLWEHRLNSYQRQLTISVF